MKILIIGLGSIASKHIQAIKSIDSEAEIFALRSSENSISVNDIVNIYSLVDLEIKFDFVIISNPTSLHRNAILEALRFNCPLFIEKPALDNLNGASEIIEKIKNNNIFTYVACNLRFHPLILFLKKYLDEHTPIINEINVYCGSYLPSWRPGQDYKESYSANASLGGGVNIDLIHELDYCLWIFGPPDDIKSIKRNVSSLNINSSDFAFYHLFYKNFTLNINLNYFRRDTKRQIEIVTQDDTLVGDLINNKLISLANGKTLFHSNFQMSETYLEQMKYFINNIKHGRKGMNDLNEGISTLKIALNEES